MKTLMTRENYNKHKRTNIRTQIINNHTQETHFTYSRHGAPVTIAINKNILNMTRLNYKKLKHNS